MSQSHSAAPAAGEGYFAYHGVWSPGVRLFRKLEFQRKAWVVSAALVVLLALVSYDWFQAKCEVIASSARQRLGVEYAQQVMLASQAARAQRRLTRVETAGKGDADALGADKALAAVRAARQAAAPAGADAQAVFESHTAFLKSLADLVAADARRETVKEMRGAETVGDVFDTRLADALAKVRQAHPELAKAIDETPGVEDMHKLHQLVNAAQTDVAAIEREAATSVEALFALQASTARELDRATRGQAQMGEETASSARAMRQQAQALAAITGRFKVT